MKGHMQDRHQAHVRKPDDKQHQEWNCRIVLIDECIQYDQCEVSAHRQFKQWHDTGPPKIFFGRPTVLLVLNFVLWRSLETGFDSKQSFHHRFRIADG